MRLEDLTRIFGGTVRELGERRWLDTEVGGLRTFIVRRETSDGAVTFDLAVFTPHTRELDPFFAHTQGSDWRLDDKHLLPRLNGGFVFAGCQRGVLFAYNTSVPSLDTTVSTLWDLAAWARKPWRPIDTEYEVEQHAIAERARVRRGRLIRIGWVVLVVGVALLLRTGRPPPR